MFFLALFSRIKQHGRDSRVRVRKKDTALVAQGRVKCGRVARLVCRLAANASFQMARAHAFAPALGEGPLNSGGLAVVSCKAPGPLALFVSCGDSRATVGETVFYLAILAPMLGALS